MTTATIELSAPNLDEVTKAVTEFIATQFPTATTSVSVSFSDFRNHYAAIVADITNNSNKYKKGLLHSMYFGSDILDVIINKPEGLVMEIKLFNVVYCNEFDLNIFVGGEPLCANFDYEFYDPTIDDGTPVCEVWLNQLHGGMVNHHHDLFLIMLFGTELDPNIRNWFLSGRMSIKGLTDQQHQDLFGMYDAFVADVLKGCIRYDNLFKIVNE